MRIFWDTEYEVEVPESDLRAEWAERNATFEGEEVTFEEYLRIVSTDEDGTLDLTPIRYED